MWAAIGPAGARRAATIVVKRDSKICAVHLSHDQRE
jgi:hypothetical protein